MSSPCPWVPVMMAAEPTVHVVDDDVAVRNALGMLLQAAQYPCRQYASASDFLDTYQPGTPGCLVLDLHMPGVDGLSLQELLARREIELPIIFLTGHANVPDAVRAMQGGAVDFMEKPFNSDRLLERVKQALQRDAANRARSRQDAVVHDRRKRLTPREAEVLDLILQGKASKVIAIELGISERTVELHRSRILRKLGVRSASELMRLLLPQDRSP